MESFYILNIILAYLPGEKSTGPGEFFVYFLLKSLNLVLIPGAKSDGDRGT